MARLDEKVAIVTGAAGGIGYASAAKMIEEGAKVVFTDLNDDNAKAIIEEFGEDKALFVKHDVTSEADWQAVVDQTLEKFGTIDILFNNAGIYQITPLTETSLEDFNKMLSINVSGVFLGMKFVAPILAEKGGGSIINNSSVAGLIGAPAHASYGASKGAVRIMSKDVAAEYAPYQVRVNSIHPGYIKTAMADYASETTQKSEEDLSKNYPLGRLGETDDVAYAVVYLASDESSYLTGIEIPIDGGQTNLPM